MPRRAIPATVCLGFLLFIAPLKLGNSASTRWATLFPANIWDWLLSAWPVSFAPVFAGVALLAVAATAETARLRADLKAYRHVCLPLAGFVLVSLIGLINTTSWEVATSFIAHLVSVFTFALALLVHLRTFPHTRNILLICWLAGLGALGIEVIYQVHWGYGQVMQALEYQIEQGHEIPSALIFNVRQGRAMASFAISNSLAAHLILALPLAVIVIWRWCRRVEPPLASQLLFSLLAGGLLTYCLICTKSRAAFLAFVMGAAATMLLVLCLNPEQTRKYLPGIIGIGIGGVAVAVPAFLWLQGARSPLSSLAARFDYWRAAVRMFQEHPWAGGGIGEFFHSYMRLKPPGAEETKLAHSMFYHFLSQCGILGGIAVVYFAVSPLLVCRQIQRDELEPASKPEAFAAIMGVLAWTIHALLDFNIHIPATVMLVPTVLILAFPPPPAAADHEPSPGTGRPWRIALAVLALLTIAQGWKLPGEKAMNRYEARLYAGRVPPGQLTNELQKAARLLPLSPHPWLKSGYAYLYYERYDRAAAAYAKAIEREPHFAAAHYRLALARYHLADLDGAEEELRQALALYPHKPKYTVLWRHIQHRKHGTVLDEPLKP